MKECAFNLDQMYKIARRVAEKGTRYAKRLLNKPFPPSSRPGEPPHKRTGVLRNTLSCSAQKLPGMRGVVATIRAIYYGFYLEKGAVGGRSIDPTQARPFLAPTYKYMQKELQKEIGTAKKGNLLYMPHIKDRLKSMYPYGTPTIKIRLM
jgi:hypothetical protein